MYIECREHPILRLGICERRLHAILKVTAIPDGLCTVCDHDPSGNLDIFGGSYPFNGTRQ